MIKIGAGGEKGEINGKREGEKRRKSSSVMSTSYSTLSHGITSMRRAFLLFFVLIIFLLSA